MRRIGREGIAYQGTLFRSGAMLPLLDLATPAGTTERTQRRSLDLLKSLNDEHLKIHLDSSELLARIESYELAFRMQTEAMSVIDLNTRRPCGHARDVWLESRTDRRFWSQMPDHAPPDRTRRTIHPDCIPGAAIIEDTWEGHNELLLRTTPGTPARPTSRYARVDRRSQTNRVYGRENVYWCGEANSAARPPAKGSTSRAAITICTGFGMGDGRRRRKKRDGMAIATVTSWVSKRWTTGATSATCTPRSCT